MKWDKIFIVLTDRGPFGKGVMRILKERYNIPHERCFNFCEKPLIGTVQARPGCLSNVDLSSKLLLCGHGEPFNYVIDGIDYSAAALARFLNRYGLREAGLISFKSCEIGAANFLDSFLAELTKNRIKVASLKAYRVMVTCRYTSRLILPKVELMELDKNGFLPDKHNNGLRKIIRGNLNSDSPGSGPISKNNNCCIVM